MKEKFQNLFIGRHGMDDFSKVLFWFGAVFVVASLFLGGLFGGLFRFLGFFGLGYSFYRAFSRNTVQREMENNLFLAYAGRIVSRYNREKSARKERFSQRKEYVFFKCPGCGTMIRVPRGKGKIHITCRCGYQLYRKT